MVLGDWAADVIRVVRPNATKYPKGLGMRKLGVPSQVDPADAANSSVNRSPRAPTLGNGSVLPSSAATR